VVHISELLAELADSGRVSLRKGLGESKVTFHDPCHLGRYCGVYDQPRQVLRGIPGLELAEMLRHREYAWCCGNGADLVRSVAPELALEIARDRVEEAGDAGAEAIITSCPRCVASLERVADGIKIYDLTVAVATAMGLEL
jgi:heterodisulfide reductase subunit D